MTHAHVMPTKMIRGHVVPMKSILAHVVPFRMSQFTSLLAVSFQWKMFVVVDSILNS
jgi:hypothetical protein